jgi:hypothetical protein
VKVAADPLSGLAADSDSGSGAGAGGEAEASDEWTAYYKNVELSNFINGDLDRLYMNGIDDEYFQKPERRQILLNVLLLWALLHKKTSYRQGMHELAGPILFVLEEEMRDPSLAQYRFSESSLEAHTFLLFSRIMQDLELLYDPSPSPHGSDKQPQVVAFCSRIQDSALRKLDPLLCAHLEASYVQVGVCLVIILLFFCDVFLSSFSLLLTHIHALSLSFAHESGTALWDEMVPSALRPRVSSHGLARATHLGLSLRLMPRSRPCLCLCLWLFVREWRGGASGLYCAARGCGRPCAGDAPLRTRRLA